MPKNKSIGFWDVHRTIKKTSKQEGLDLPSKKIFNISNYYVQLLEEDTELECDFDPKTYEDPTGEEAIRHWFRSMVRTHITEAIRTSLCSAAEVTHEGLVRCNNPAVHSPSWDPDNPICEHHLESFAGQSSQDERTSNPK